MLLLANLVSLSNAIHKLLIELILATKAEFMDMIATRTLNPIKKRLFPSPPKNEMPS